MHLQHVAYDSHTPHIRLEVDGFVADDLRGYEFRCTKEHTHRSLRVQALGQSKVNYLDLVAGASVAHNVLRLQIQVHHTLAVHVGDSFANLSQKENTVQLCQREVIGHHPLEEFSSSNTRRIKEPLELVS